MKIKHVMLGAFFLLKRKESNICPFFVWERYEATPPPRNAGVINFMVQHIWFEVKRHSKHHAIHDEKKSSISIFVVIFGFVCEDYP